MGGAGIFVRHSTGVMLLASACVRNFPNGGATVEILAPDSSPNSTRRQNDESLGMKITHGDTSMMKATRSVVPNKARQTNYRI